MKGFGNLCLFVVISVFLRPAKGLQGDHVCHNEETYQEVEQQKTTHPVRVRSYNWCFSIPPRCSNYRTELREVTKFQNVTKTRVTEFCCDGYTKLEAETKTSAPPINSSSSNTIICIPTCRGGCVEGVCTAPNQCACNVGYEGRFCSQRCRFRMFGPNCRKVCRCRNGALCDHRTGYCRCTAGWTGQICDQPCRPGQYGMMCRNSCTKRCPSGRCHSQSGECTTDDPQIVFESNHEGTSSGPPVLSNVMKLSPEDRIPAKHWIQVIGNGNLSLRNCTNQEAGDCVPLNATATPPVDGAHLANLIDQTHQHHVQLHNNNSIVMDAINSSIANLTTDVGKLSKQLGEQQQHKIVVEQVPHVVQGGMAFILDHSEIHSIVGAEPLSSGTYGEQVKLVSVTDGAANNKDAGNELVNSTETNEVYHILTLAEANRTADNIEKSPKSDNAMDNPPMVPVVLVVLVALILVALVSFVLTYAVRRANGAEPVGQRVTRRAQHVQEIDMSDHVLNQKPLPDIPSFTQSFKRREAEQQSFYDRPSNNLSIASGLNTLGYSYTTATAAADAIPSSPISAPASPFVVIPPTIVVHQPSTGSRKSSLEHIYDEIQYADRHAANGAASKR